MKRNSLSRRTILQIGSSLVGASLLPLQTVMAQQNNGAETVLQWNNAALQAIQTTRSSVTITARALAILHTSMYDAWATYDDIAYGTQYGGLLRQPASKRTPFNKQKAISYAAYRTLIDLFPGDIPYFTSVMDSMGYDSKITMVDATSPAGIGNLIAYAVLYDRHHDGSNQLGNLNPGPYSDYTGYTPINSADLINDPNRWQPLRISDGKGGFIIQHCTTPQWRYVKPFAIHSPAQMRPAPPARYSDELYRSQAQQILAYSANLNDTQKVIAEYWQDGPGTVQPPGHWCLHAQYIVQRDGYDLDQTIRLFFALANTLLDVSIACWDTKLAYDSVRPITAIHYLFRGQQIQAWGGPGQRTRTISGEDWHPYQQSTVVTPPFPEYCSGHSTFSAASAFILRTFTGNDLFGASYIKKAGTSNIEPGTVPATDISLKWNTFSDAAQEAGISRRYGGIHFAQGDLSGRMLGQQIGAMVWMKAQEYILGSS